MVVDIAVKRTPGYTVASITRTGPWRDNMWQREFEQLLAWTKENGLRTGKWLLYSHDPPEGSRGESKRRWEACLEIKGKARSEGAITVKKIPPETVARVAFNPEEVSPELVYSGLLGWADLNGTYRGKGPIREVYDGSPWTDARAWAHAEVQLPVRKK